LREPPLLLRFLNQNSQQDSEDLQDWAVPENNALPKNPANLVSLTKILVQKYTVGAYIIFPKQKPNSSASYV